MLGHDAWCISLFALHASLALTLLSHNAIWFSFPILTLFRISASLCLLQAAVSFSPHALYSPMPISSLHLFYTWRADSKVVTGGEIIHFRFISDARRVLWWFIWFLAACLFLTSIYYHFSLLAAAYYWYTLLFYCHSLAMLLAFDAAYVATPISGKNFERLPPHWAFSFS